MFDDLMKDDLLSKRLGLTPTDHYAKLFSLGPSSSSNGTNMPGSGVLYHPQCKLSQKRGVLRFERLMRDSKVKGLAQNVDRKALFQTMNEVRE